MWTQGKIICMALLLDIRFRFHGIPHNLHFIISCECSCCWEKKKTNKNTFRIESNEKKIYIYILHAGNITTGATYTPLFLFLSLSLCLGLRICVHLFGIHHGNVNGVVAQKTLGFIKTFNFSRYKTQPNKPSHRIRFEEEEKNLRCGQYYSDEVNKKKTSTLTTKKCYATARRIISQFIWNANTTRATAGDDRKSKIWRQLTDTLLL